MILKQLIEQIPDYESQIETRFKQIYAPFFDSLVPPEKLEELINTVPVTMFLEQLKIGREDCLQRCRDDSKLKPVFLEGYDRQIAKIEEVARP